MYLTHFAPVLTNYVILSKMDIGSIGGFKEYLGVCLGDVFNLPMPTVTIVEDLSMAGRAGLMLLLM